MYVQLLKNVYFQSRHARDFFSTPRALARLCNIKQSRQKRRFNLFFSFWAPEISQWKRVTVCRKCMSVNIKPLLVLVFYGPPHKMHIGAKDDGSQFKNPVLFTSPWYTDCVSHTWNFDAKCLFVSKAPNPTFLSKACCSPEEKNYQQIQKLLCKTPMNFPSSSSSSVLGGDNIRYLGPLGLHGRNNLPVLSLWQIGLIQDISATNLMSERLASPQPFLWPKLPGWENTMILNYVPAKYRCNLTYSFTESLSQDWFEPLLTLPWLIYVCRIITQALLCHPKPLKKKSTALISLSSTACLRSNRKYFKKLSSLSF